MLPDVAAERCNHSSRSAALIRHIRGPTLYAGSFSSLIQRRTVCTETCSRRETSCGVRKARSGVGFSGNVGIGCCPRSPATLAIRNNNSVSQSAVSLYRILVLQRFWSASEAPRTNVVERLSRAVVKSPAYLAGLLLYHDIDEFTWHDDHLAWRVASQVPLHVLVGQGGRTGGFFG